MYVIVRVDLSSQQQLVQAAHAAFEMGTRYPRPRDSPYHLIALQARDALHMQELIDQSRSRDLTLYVMSDSDLMVGPTSFATTPLTRDQGKIYSQLPLWGKGTTR